MTKKPAPVKPPTAHKPEHLPFPARNLGPHLKAPKSGEIVTEHRYTRKGKA